MSYSYHIYTSASEIPYKDWNIVSSHSPYFVFMDYRFLMIVEHSLKSTTKFWYILFYSNQIPIACTVFSLFPIDISIISGQLIKRTVNTIRRLYPSFLKLKV